jgi:ribosomal protein S18 acetylase RimI-like enzyme
MILRRLTREDVADICRIEIEAYLPSLHESAEAFLRLIELFPEGAWASSDEEGLCGYGIGVPVLEGTTIELRQVLTEVPLDADTFYIHDVAVAPRCRRRGVARALVTQLLDVARRRGFARCELVSVQGSASFWERFGFQCVREFEYAPGAQATRMMMLLGDRSDLA